MSKDSEQFFRELKKDITHYGELKLELLKLGAYERTGKVVSVLSYGLILMSLSLFLIFSIFLALGFFLSDLLHSTGAGFSIVAILYIALIGSVIGFKEKIRTYILNNIIEALTSDDNTTDTTDKQNNDLERNTAEQTAN